jgi:AcrR family transcriptional regulator
MEVNPSPPKQRRTQAERSAATREALLTAARELFADKGYAATGRELVADRAGVTRGALYHHFANKQALFAAVVEALELETCTRIAYAAMAEQGSALDALRKGCQAFLDSALEPAVRQIVLIDAPAVLGWEAWREMDIRYGYALLREGIDHVLKDENDIPAPASQVDTIAHLLLGALNEAALLVATADSPRRARIQVGATVDALLGLLASGGLGTL